MPPPDFAGDRFEVRNYLGAGSCGAVYEVFDRRMGAVVALKTLTRAEPELLYLFKQEFRSLADVHHRHLVTLYELLFEGDRWFFTMELVRGSDLMSWVRPHAVIHDTATGELATETVAETPRAMTGTPLPRGASASPLAPEGLARLRLAMLGLAEGVSALHRARKLHRDLKPSNIRVEEPGGRVVLVDFGLVVPIEAEGVSKPLHVAGTPTYMSPEQAAGHAIDEASDWYAAGVILFQALTGTTPFAGLDSSARLRAKQTADAPAPSTVVGGVPEDLDQLCAALLRRDPARRPRDEEVMARLMRAAPEVRRAPSQEEGVPRFIGRQAELARLDAALEATHAGRPALVFLRGASGIGKSRLCQAFAERLMERDASAVVLTGRCYQQETVPFKGLDSVIDALSGFLAALPAAEVQSFLPRDVVTLGRLFPVLRQIPAFADAASHAPALADQVEQRRRAFAALRELLGRIAARRPLVLALDDLQWGAEDSGALLAELLQPPDAPAMLVLGTCRSDEAEAGPLLARLRPQLERISDTLHCEDVQLDPLQADQARALAASLLDGDPSGARVARIADEGEGSPFFICELARHQHVGQAEEPLRTLALDEVILARVGRLSATAQRLLGVVVIAGRPLGRDLALRAADLGDESAAALAELRSAHLLRQRADHLLEAYHDRIRDGMLVSIDAARSIATHLRLAELMERGGGADPEHLTRHFLAGGERRRAASHAVAAARRASASLAFERAAELYQLALELQAWEPAEQRDLRVRLGDALAYAGEGARAGQAYLQAAELCDAESALELRRRAAEQLLMSGRIDVGTQVLRSVLHSVGLPFPGSDRAAMASVVWQSARLQLRGLRYRVRPAPELAPELLRRIDVCWTVAHGLAGASPLHSIAYAARGARLALDAGEPSRIAQFLALHATLMSAVAPGRWEKMIGVAAVAVEQSGSEYIRILQHVMYGVRLYFAGELAAAVTECSLAEKELRERCRGVAWEIITAQSLANFSRTFLADWHDTAVLVQEQVRAAEQRGDLYGAATLGMALGWVRHLAADDPDAALRELDEYLARWSSTQMHYQHYYDVETRAYVLLYRGEPRAALAYLDKRWPALRAAGVLRARVVQTLGLALRITCLIESAYEPGVDRRGLLKRARRDIRTMRRQPFRGADSWGLHLEGCLAAAEGDRDGAVTRLRESGQLMSELGFRTGPLCGGVLLGELLGGDEGAALVARADEFFRQQGFRNPRRFACVFAPGAGRPRG